MSRSRRSTRSCASIPSSSSLHPAAPRRHFHRSHSRPGRGHDPRDAPRSHEPRQDRPDRHTLRHLRVAGDALRGRLHRFGDRKSTRLNSSHSSTSYAVFCLKKKNTWYGLVLLLKNEEDWLLLLLCPPFLNCLQAVKKPPLFFFFNDTATTEIYTLSLHDALPISANIAS